jgi:hypothetical protein
MEENNTVTVLRKVVKRKVIKPKVDDIKPKVDDKQLPTAQTSVGAQTSVEEKKPLSKDQLIPLYIEQLSPQEKIVLKIAREHLETSFCIEKSLGFLEWHKKYLSMMSS